MFYGHQAERFGGHGGSGVVGWIIPLLFLALLIGLVIFAVTWLTSHHGPWPRAAGPVGPFGGVGPGGPRYGPPDAAAEQVRFRYARGEMSRDEYYRLMGDLGWSAPAPAAFGPPPPPPSPTSGAAAAPPPAPAPPPPGSAAPPPPVSQ